MKTSSKHLQVNGVTLVYDVYPREHAPVVVLIPGLSSTKESYNLMIPYLTDRYHVLSLDQRGHGQSTKEGPYTFAQLNEDLLAILDREGIDKATLVGGSFSSVPVQMFAVKHPERVDKLVLLDGGYFRRADLPEFDLEQFMQQPPFSAASVEEMIEGVVAGYGEYANDYVREQLKREIELREDGRAYLAMPHEAFLAYAGEYSTYDRVKLLSELNVPVLVLLAENAQRTEEQRAYFDSSLQDYLQRVPTAEALKIPHAHHALMLSHPKETAEAVIRFLS